MLERGLARRSEMFDRDAPGSSWVALDTRPRVRITGPHSPAISTLLRDSDMLWIAPVSFARALTRGDSGLAMRRRPYLSGVAATRSAWHCRHDHDAGHGGLRDLWVDVARATGTRQAAGG